MNTKHDARTNSRRDLLNDDYYQGFDRQEVFPRSSYRSRPKELPIVSQNIRQSKMRSHRREDKERRRRDQSSRKETKQETRSERSERGEKRRRRRGDDRQNRGEVNSEKQMDNPFHENFNKVIENPFLKAQEVMTEPASSEDNESVWNSTNQWEVGGESFGQAEETVNTAIVDIYDSEDGCDPFLKMRVVVLSCVFIIQFVCGFTKVLVIHNQMNNTDQMSLSPSQICLPLHMVLLGGLSSTLILPLFLFWSRIKSLSIACMLYLTCIILALFSSVSWMYRLSEFLSGLGSGLSLPLIHIYSAEVFSGQRRFKLAIVIYLLEATGELFATVIVTVFSVEAACLFCLAVSLPCLACTSCFAPESPRFLLVKNEKTLCVDSLQWLRGHMSDLSTEFTQLADCLDKSVGAKALVETVTKKAVLAPVALCVLIIIVASSSGLFSFILLFITNFSGSRISPNLMMVEAALKIGGCLAGLLLGPRIGLKMLLLLGFASSSAICLFVAILSHLTSTGSSWAGLVSLSLFLLSQHSSFGPLKWLLIVELSPVFHIIWAVTLAAASFWAFSLVQVMLFPLVMQVPNLGLSILSWAGSVSTALSYVITLWLVPDLRKCSLGGMEQHFRQVFSGTKKLKTFQTSGDESSVL